MTKSTFDFFPKYISKKNIFLQNSLGFPSRKFPCACWPVLLTCAGLWMSVA